MKIKTAQKLIKDKIESNPKVYGRDKTICISEILASDNITAITVKSVLTFDRAWRKVLSDNKHLDFRGDTSEQEREVKKDLGYAT